MDSKATAMRQQMDETMAGLTGKLGELEHHISATVKTVKDSVNTVRDNLDLKLQVRRRPWTLVAGAAALGFIGGFRTKSRENGHARQNGNGYLAVPIQVAPTEHQNSGGNGTTTGVDVERHLTSPTPTWLGNLGDRFQPEIAELKGIVIGTLIGIAREVITKQVAEPIGRSIRDARNNSNARTRHEGSLSDETKET